MKKTKPIPFLEIWTNSLFRKNLASSLEYFKKDEDTLYGHCNLSIPTIAICVFPWLARKSLLQQFNMKTASTYLQRSSNILRGKATDGDFCKQCFIHIHFSHEIKTSSKKATKLFRKNKKQDMMFFVACRLIC